MEEGVETRRKDSVLISLTHKYICGRIFCAGSERERSSEQALGSVKIHLRRLGL